MNPYYQDESVTLYHGRCEDILPAIPAASAHVLLTDPPYFEVKDDEWDNQWEGSAEFLSWLGEVLDLAKPALTANASVWVFAGPALASQVEAVVRDRFRVLNAVRWYKEQGWHQKAEIAAQRRYLTPWESVTFAEQIHDDPDRIRKGHMVQVGNIITTARERRSISRQTVASSLMARGLYKNKQTGAAMCSDWEYGDSLPPEGAYDVLANWLPDLPPFSAYRDLYLEALRDFEESRRPFALRRSGPVSDLWNFDTVAPYAGKHPCEKPQALLRHMIDVSSRPGDLILDPFAGSGSTLLAARDAGRRAIGIEMDLGYCQRIASRLAQGVLDLGEPA